jgi:hypothetical protein
MAQTGYTPISIYYSATSTNVPTAGNLVAGELAINTADGKLFYKDSSGVVQVIGTKGGVGSSTTTQVLYNSSGLVVGSANMTFNGTSLTLANDASISGLTIGKGGSSISVNTALGTNALSANTTGSGTAIGYFALKSNTTGTYNTAIGGNDGINHAALESNTTGGANIAIGGGALWSNISGNYNTAVGLNAIASSTTGYNNTAFGYISLTANTTGHENTAIGYGSLASSQTASYNTAIGQNALRAVTAGSNTAIGVNAAISLTTGVNNSFIGCLNSANQGCGELITTGSKNSILGGFNGNQGSLDIRTASNFVVLSDGDGNPRGIFDNNGKFLVRTSSVSSAGVFGAIQGNAEIISLGTSAGLAWENRSGGVTSNSNWYMWYTTSGTIYLYNGAGNAASISPSTGVYTPLSDVNKKKDFAPSTLGLDAVMQLKPTLYRMKSEDDSVPLSLGFIAQDVKDVIPEAYVETKNENANGDADTFIGLQSMPIIATLAKAIQELKAEVDSLKQQLASK